MAEWARSRLIKGVKLSVPGAKTLEAFVSSAGAATMILTPDDITLWQLNCAKFCRAIAKAFGLTSKFQLYEPPSGVIWLG